MGFGLNRAAQISAETIPDKAVIKNILNREFKILVGLSGLATQLKQEQDNIPDFAANWAIVSGWTPDARYETSDITSAQTLIEAIRCQKSGVFRWIKAYW